MGLDGFRAGLENSPFTPPPTTLHPEFISPIVQTGVPSSLTDPSYSEVTKVTGPPRAIPVNPFIGHVRPSMSRTSRSGGGAGGWRWALESIPTWASGRVFEVVRQLSFSVLGVNPKSRWAQESVQIVVPVKIQSDGLILHRRAKSSSLKSSLMRRLWWENAHIAHNLRVISRTFYQKEAGQECGNNFIQWVKRCDICHPCHIIYLFIYFCLLYMAALAYIVSLQ